MPDGVPTTLGALLRRIREALHSTGSPDAGLDARLIVEHAAGVSPTTLVTDPDRIVSPGQGKAALAMLARRLAGEPVHRIFGFREFYGLKLGLSKETLEPRPDTEALVDLALPFVRAAADRNGVCRVLDLGTGTGAVALALLSQEPRALAVGIDVANDALATAVANADINGLSDRFEARVSDWYSAVDGRFHIIVSNPPYIRSREIETLPPEVRLHDPRAALDGGEDGLDAYRLIAAGAASHLTGDGVVVVEIGYDQAADVEAVFAAADMVLAGSGKDLAGHVRALRFAWT
jgi:release factor glutamine methyltransferase